MSGSARTRSEQSCIARVLRTNESKCNRPEDSDVLRDTHSGRVSAARGARDEPRQLRRTAEMGGNATFPIGPARDAHAWKADIYCLRPRYPALCLFKHRRWQLNGQRSTATP